MVEDGQQQSSRSLLSRSIFWDFPRASWPYDVAVGLILIFIFVTPRAWFHDQPKAASVVLLSPAHGVNRVFLATELLDGAPSATWPDRAQSLIRQRTGKTWKVVRVEPIQDEAEKEVKGYIAYTAP